MPPRAVLELFRDVSAGKISDPLDIRVAIEPFTKPTLEAHSEQSAEELKLLKLVLNTQNVPKIDATERGALETSGADGMGGSNGGCVSDSPALGESPEVAKTGLCRSSAGNNWPPFHYVAMHESTQMLFFLAMLHP